ncbi:sensor histidine kinase [Massilia glaciei]|uniref:histidine kinase n=1 Tax=Massilia glaciei TaxID=1524097 RepID=A0A2U2HG30_9BURK|nr:histidine kinase [Massilia glaciei]PWF43659.1 histidine kinase [Massilia glaciei]
MTAPRPPQVDEELERLVAERSAGLNELLGHATSCWDEERRLLARQLHDNLGSSMTALTMHLALLTKHLPADPALQDRAAQMKLLLLNIINTNREMQLALWNDKLEFLGIKAAVSELVGEFAGAHGVVARTSLPDEDADYPRLVSVALLRCLEEGLRNVAAHARATELDVILDDNGDDIMLTVRDNGVGPGSAGNGPAPHHGLRMLRERALYLGGVLTLGPGPTGGTALSMILPRAAAPA